MLVHISARVANAAAVCDRARVTTSTTALGRPPGFPDCPGFQGMPRVLGLSVMPRWPCKRR